MVFGAARMLGQRAALFKRRMAQRRSSHTEQGQVKPKVFRTADDFDRWLQRHHASAPELLVGFYKVTSGTPSMTWAESVDQALCFDFIDGVRFVRRRLPG